MNKLTVKVITNDFMASDGKHYYIVKTTLNGKRQYGVIDYEWVDENGKLNREVNGFMMRLHDTVAKLIDYIEKEVKYHKLQEHGIDEEVALYMAMCELTREEAEALLNRTA